MDREKLIDALALIAWNSEPKNARTIIKAISLLEEQNDEINELRSIVEFWKKKALHA